MKLSKNFSFVALLVLSAGCAPEPIPLDHPEFNFELREALIDEVAPHILEWIEMDPGDGSFLVLLTDQEGKDGGAAFAQISVENGAIGIDHVLNIDRHVETEGRFREFGEVRGYEVHQLYGGGVRYLRFLSDVPARDIQEVLSDVFQIDYELTVGIFGRVHE